MTQATYDTSTRSALSDSTSHAGTISASAAVGSVAVAYVLLYQAPGSQPALTGWTRIRDYYSYDANSFGQAVLVKNATVVAGDQGASFNFAHGAGARQGYVVIVTVANGDLTKALAETARVFGNFGAAALPAVTTAYVEGLIISVATDRNDSAHSTPSGYTKQSERITGGYDDCLYHQQVPTATTIAQVSITPNAGRCQAVSVPIYGTSAAPPADPYPREVIAGMVTK